jgi:hypothetical protein
MLTSLLFSVFVISLSVVFFRKTFEKWNIEELYIKFAPKFLPDELCFWCLHFWLSVVIGFIVMLSFGVSLITMIFSIILSTVVSHKIFEWEQ